MYADKGEEALQPALSGAYVNCLCASENVSLRQSCKILRLHFQKETGHHPPMGLVCLWHPGSSVSHAGLWGSCVVLLVTLSVKRALE